VHGVLLQARALLQSAAAAAPPPPAAAAAIAAAVPLLAARLWLLGPACACAPLGAEYAAACVAVLALANPDANPGSRACDPEAAKASACALEQAVGLAAALRRTCAAALGIKADGGEEEDRDDGSGERSNGGGGAGSGGEASAPTSHVSESADGTGEASAPISNGAGSNRLLGGWAEGEAGALQVGRAGALREVALLFFSGELRRALGGAAEPVSTARSGSLACSDGGITRAEVAAALAHSAYEVRAATLKALRMFYAGERSRPRLFVQRCAWQSASDMH